MPFLIDLFLILIFLSFSLFVVGGLYRLFTTDGSKHKEFGRTLTLYGIRFIAAALVILFVLFLRS